MAEVWVLNLKRMAVSQRHREAQNGRGHGREGNTFVWAMVRKKDDENALRYLEVRDKA